MEMVKEAGRRQKRGRESSDRRANAVQDDGNADKSLLVRGQRIGSTRLRWDDALDLLRYLVQTTELKTMLNDPRVGGLEAREAKEALTRLAERSTKP